MLPGVCKAEISLELLLLRSVYGDEGMKQTSLLPECVHFPNGGEIILRNVPDKAK